MASIVEVDKLLQKLECEKSETTDPKNNSLEEKKDESMELKPKYQFKKIPLSSINKIKSSPKLILELQEQFCNDSFIIITNDIVNKHKLIETAEKTAIKFFTTTSNEDKDKLRGEVELGYLNTTSKQGYHIKLVNNKYKDHHPWPNNIDKFESIFTETFQCLQDICIEFVDILAKNNYLSDVIKNIPDDLNKFEAIGRPIKDDKKVSSSLLSLFYYENKEENKDKTNCMEHIDQGFVSLEPHSSVSGLEIFLKDEAEWIRIDEPQYMKNNDLILFCSETFHRLSGGKYNGTMHRVGKNNKPRLSMVYKMRHRDIEKDLELHFGDDENYAFYQYDQNGNLVRLTSADY